MLTYVLSCIEQIMLFRTQECLDLETEWFFKGLSDPQDFGLLVFFYSASNPAQYTTFFSHDGVQKFFKYRLYY